MTQKPTKRKRGKELNDAIFQAALFILKNEGYDAVSFQDVAKRAGTSRSVLYRHWQTPFNLLSAATSDKILSTRDSLHDITFDTGSLRGDLISVLNYLLDNLRLFPENMIPAIAQEIARGNNPFSPEFFASEEFFDKILSQALTRGEIKALPKQSQRALFFNVIRYDMIFNFSQMNYHHLEVIVDEILLPIYFSNSAV